MKRVCVVCEGQTEETFVRDVLAPALIDLGVHLNPETIETSPGHKGGALRYDRVKRHLRNTLRQRNAPTVTTLFDLYRLDSGFPGHDSSKAQVDLGMRLSVLTSALHADIVAEAGCRAERFIPYIQPYEFPCSSTPRGARGSPPAWPVDSNGSATCRRPAASTSARPATPADGRAGRTAAQSGLPRRPR